jgi:hypothetical protein
VELDFGDGLTQRLVVAEALIGPVELEVPTPKRRPLRPVDASAFPDFEALAQRDSARGARASTGWTPKALAAAIARDPLPALAVSAQPEKALEASTLVRVTAPGSFERLAGLEEAEDGRLVLPVKLPTMPPGEQYGWGYPPGARHCEKVRDLPRRCLPLRTVVDPGLPSWVAELMFKAHLRLAERRRLFGWGLTRGQVEAAERFYADLDPYMPARSSRS